MNNQFTRNKITFELFDGETLNADCWSDLFEDNTRQEILAADIVVIDGIAYKVCCEEV